jgi:hypothetical protein
MRRLLALSSLIVAAVLAQPPAAPSQAPAAAAQPGPAMAPRVTSPLVVPTLPSDEMMADLQDEELVKTLMARSFSIEDAYRSPELQQQLAAETQLLMRAAERRVARANARLAVATAQVESGNLAADSLRNLALEAQIRLDAYQLALTQSRLIEDILEGARASQSRLRGMRPRAGAVERFAGNGVFTLGDLRVIQVAFQRKFYRMLPISAFGATALHRTLGLDHTGKVDVAINPDQQEGVWLRDFLQHRGIPYYAFRTAILGMATAPHIHIGTGSNRIRSSARPVVSGRRTTAVPHAEMSRSGGS